MFNLFGGEISWMRNRQVVVALSTTKMNTWHPLMQARKQYGYRDCVQEIRLVQQAVRSDCDSQSAIFLAKNPTYHSKIKHIDVQYHFVRDMVEDKVLLLKLDTLKNIVDPLTKFVSTEKFSWCREAMGIFSLNC